MWRQIQSVTDTFNILSLRVAITHNASDKNVAEIVLGQDMDITPDIVANVAAKVYDTHKHSCVGWALWPCLLGFDIHFQCASLCHSTASV